MRTSRLRLAKNDAQEQQRIKQHDTFSLSFSFI